MVPQISITIGFQKKNSSDLDMGQCPKLKSDKFFFWNPLLIPEIAILCLKTLKRLLHCLGALPKDTGRACEGAHISGGGAQVESY